MSTSKSPNNCRSTAPRCACSSSYGCAACPPCSPSAPPSSPRGRRAHHLSTWHAHTLPAVLTFGTTVVATWKARTPLVHVARAHTARRAHLWHHRRRHVEGAHTTCPRGTRTLSHVALCTRRPRGALHSPSTWRAQLMPTIYVALDTGLGLSSLCVSWDALAIAASQSSGGLALRDAAVEMSSVP